MNIFSFLRPFSHSPIRPSSDVHLRHSLWLSRYTKLLTVVTFFLVIAGGLVTSTGSGLSVPDWPLSYGQVMPPLVGGIRYEHSHRMIASFVGFLTLILAIWLGIVEKRKWLRRLGIVALGAVVLQGILGGLTVLYLLPAPVSIFHACLAQSFFALTVALAFFTSRECSGNSSTNSGRTDVIPECINRESRIARSPILRQAQDGERSRTIKTFGDDIIPARTDTAYSELKRLLWMCAMLIYLQLILGATLRHTVNHLVSISHIVGGFFVLAASILVMLKVVGRSEEERFLVRPAIVLALGSLFQMSFGMGSFIYKIMLPPASVPSAGQIFFVTAHQSAGALLLAAAVFMLLRVYRWEGKSNE